MNAFEYLEIKEKKEDDENSESSIDKVKEKLEI